MKYIKKLVRWLHLLVVRLVKWQYLWVVLIPRARLTIKWQLEQAEKTTDEFSWFLNLHPEAYNLPDREFDRYISRLSEIRERLHLEALEPKIYPHRAQTNQRN